MNLKNIVTDKVREVKQNAHERTIGTVKSDWALGKSKADLIERRLAVAARNGEGSTPAEPVKRPAVADYTAEKSEPPVFTRDQAFDHYRKLAPATGWQACSFREIQKGDWVRVSFTGLVDDVRYGVAHTFTNKNWWVTQDGHMLVGPAAIRAGHGQMTTGTMVFNPSMTLQRIPAPVFLVERKTLKERVKNRATALIQGFKDIASTAHAVPNDSTSKNVS